jgi:hypothetical protein
MVTTRISKRPTLPQARTCSQAEAIQILRRQLFEDAEAAGWLSPCATKPNKKDAPSKIYSVAEIQLVETRVLAGEYPNAA